MRFILPLFFVFFLLAGCTSISTSGIESGPSSTPLFYAQATGSTATGAMNAAKAIIIRRAADNILGVASSVANKEELDSFLSQDNDVNAFIHRDSLEIIDRGNEDGSFYARIRVRIDLSALSSVLASRGIIGGQVLPRGGKVVLEDEVPPVWLARVSAAQRPDMSPADAAAAEPEIPVSDPGLTDEEMARVRKYIENLSFVVYFDDTTSTEPFLMKAAVSSANKYLALQGYSFRDLDQVEKIRTDQERAYEEETGRSISMIQWIASKLRADVYVEISASVSSYSEDRRSYGSAAVTLNIFESATGAGIGQAYYQTSPPAFSTISESDALNNAMASAVYKAMPEAIRLAEEGFRKAVSRGIAYELVFISTPDSRTMREFQQRMERRTQSFSRTSFSREETRYTARFIGSVEELEFLVYDIAENVAGLENITMIMQRGNSMTFETGM